MCCRLFALLLLHLWAFTSFAKEVSIGLCYEAPIRRVRFTAYSGDYNIIAGNNQLIGVLNMGEALTIVSNANRKLEVPGLGSFEQLRVFTNSEAGSFLLDPLLPNLFQRKYAGNVSLSTDAQGNIIVINELEEAKYLAGVIETEAGISAHMEFYKAQAILCRTYLYTHFNRHAKDGFNLCDGVHCQAYHGEQTNAPIIAQAVRRTGSLLLVDKTQRPISPVFHANCGGQSCNSEDVWTNAMPYLRSVRDPYCTRQRGAVWQVKISLNEWSGFMRMQGVRVLRSTQYNYIQTTRQKYYVVRGVKVPLVKIRQYFKLRSTFFDVSVIGSSVLLQGKGYGHGVGLCQEGAMQRAARGMMYDDILFTYYRSVDIIPFLDAVHLPYMLGEYENIFNPWMDRVTNTEIVVIEDD